MSANPSDQSNDSEMNDALSNPLSQQEFEHLSQQDMEGSWSGSGSGSGDDDYFDPETCDSDVMCCPEDE